MNNDFSYTILEYINNAIRNNSIQPLNLGGISSSGGGSGTPPGGFVGYLPQTRVAYDLSESEDITSSGSLLDNLNHMRYRLSSVEEVVSLSGGHLVLDEGIPVTPRVNLDFIGEGVSLSDDSETGTTIVTISGGGSVDEAPEDGEQYIRKDGNWAGIDWSVPEGTDLQIGSSYPTSSKIVFSDDNVAIYEKSNNVLAMKAGDTDFLVAGYDTVTPYGYTVLLGDVAQADNGYFLTINQDGFDFNGNITASGNITVSGDIYASNMVYEAPLGAITYGRQNGAWVAVSGSGVTTSGGHIIMDEGVELTQRDYINFVGSGITVTDGTVGGDLNSDPVLDATASADLDTAATYLEWSHVLGSGSDRIVIVGVALRTATSSSVTFNGVSMTLLRRDRPGTDVCSELWYILESELPIGGTYTVRVNASESAKFVGGSISYSNCIGIVEGSATGDTGTASWSDVPMIDPFATHQVMIDVIALQEGGNSVTEGDVGQYAFCNENTGDAVGGMSWKVWEEEGEYDGSIWIFGNSSVWASTIVVIQGGALGTAATIVTVTGATGSFTTADSKTVTVVGGIITSIV